MSTTASRDGLLRFLSPVVAATGCELESLEVTPAGKRRVLRVVVDRDGGVSLDHVADVSRAVSGALDDSDIMGATPYVLEVTSPGVDRPLVEPRHWRRATGRLVRLSTADGGEVTGRVVASDDDGVQLDVEGEVRPVSWAQVRRGTVQVEFARRDEAGQDGDGTSGDGSDEAGEE